MLNLNDRTRLRLRSMDDLDLDMFRSRITLLGMMVSTEQIRRSLGIEA